MAVPPNNDVDVFANNIGLFAIADKNGSLKGFNVCVGGGWASLIPTNRHTLVSAM